MPKPNDVQVEAALGVLREYQRQHGTTAAEAVQRRVIFSIYSVLTGDGEVAQEYKEAAKMSAINDPNDKSKSQLSNASDPDSGESTGDPERGGSTARRATTGPGSTADQQRAEAARRAGHDPQGAVSPDNSGQQLPGGGDQPVYPGGRPRATTEIQSWPPTDAELPKYTKRELMPLTMDELIDYAIPAQIEGYEDMEHDELVDAIYKAAFGDDAKEDGEEVERNEVMRETPAGGDEQGAREEGDVNEGETPAQSTERREEEGGDSDEEEGDEEEDDEEEEESEQSEEYTEEELQGMNKAELLAIANSDEYGLDMSKSAKNQDIIDAILEEQG